MPARSACIGACAVTVVLAIAVLSGCAPGATKPARVAAPHRSSAATGQAADGMLTSELTTAGPLPDTFRKVLAARRRLEAELVAAPFTAETTVPLLGAPRPGGDGAGLPVTDPTRPDGFEPDDTRAQATVLHRGQSQLHTISNSHDVDWIALPNDEGKGYYYVQASDQLVIKSLIRADDGGLGDETTDEHNVDLTPTWAGRFGGLGRYSWLEVTAKQPTAYRISHLSLAPSAQVGEEGPDVNVMQFFSDVIDLDTADYYVQTGLIATADQLKMMRTQLVGPNVKDSGSEEYIQSPEHAALQRSIVRYGISSASPLNFLWLRSEKRHGRWVVVAAGKDASYQREPWTSRLTEYLRLTDWEGENMKVAKPAIYLYPSREQSVSVHLGYESALASTAPAIQPATRTWEVRATPDGRLTDTSGRVWPYLYWEGVGSPLYDLRRGTVIRGADAGAYLTRELPQRGLSPAESAAFRAYWVPRLAGSPWVLVHWEGAAYERCAPLDVTPRPDASIRVFMVAEPLAEPTAVLPQRLDPPPLRHGFTLVEWGGTLVR